MKLLVVSPNWLGDIVMSQSLLIAIKQQNPETEIDILAPNWAHSILNLMPEVNNKIAFNNRPGKLELAYRFNISKTIRKKGYHQVIILPNSFKSALIPFLAKIPIRTGWRGEFRYGLINDCRILNKNKLPLMVSRYESLAYDKQNCYNIKAHNPKIIIPNKQLGNLRQKFGFNIKPILAVCPGAAFGNAKQWSIEYYAKIIEYMLANSWQVVLLGAEYDRVVCNSIVANIDNKIKNNIYNIAGKTTLEQAIHLLAVSNLVISNDSGLMHVAAALAKPQIAIFGPTDPKHSPPLNAKAKIVSADNIECSPCHQRTCPLKHHKCMQKLQPQQVIAELSQFIK